MDDNNEVAELRRLVEKLSDELTGFKRTSEERSKSQVELLNEVTTLKKLLREQSSELVTLRHALEGRPRRLSNLDQEPEVRPTCQLLNSTAVSGAPTANGARTQSREVSTTRARELLQTNPPPVSGATKSESRAASTVADLKNEWGETLDAQPPPWVERQRAIEKRRRDAKREASPDTLDTQGGLPLASRQPIRKKPRMVLEVVVPTLTPETRRLYVHLSPPSSEHKGKGPRTLHEDEANGNEDDWETSSLSSLSSLTSLSLPSSLDSLPGPSVTGSIATTAQSPLLEQVSPAPALDENCLMTQVSTSNSPPPNSGYQDMHARQPEERYRGPSRELSYVDAGWPVCPPPRPDEDLLPLPLATELPHEPHNIDSESLSDPALNVRTTPFTPNSAGRTTSPPCPVTEGPALSNQVSSVGHPQQFESPKRLLIPSNNRTTIPAPSARPFASSSVLDRGSGYGGPQASPSDHAQHSFREQARRTSPTVAGVKVQLGSPLMDNIAAQQRLEGAVRYEVNVDPALRALTVDRIFMASAFGGHIQHFSTRVEGRSFLYPTLAMDPELPLEFGMPGLLCRASRSREWGDGPQRLFVGLRSGHFRYVGEYELTPSTPLSVKEYRALASKVKVKWAEAIRRKKKHKDVRVRILMRRQNGREASDLELAAAVADKKRAYDDLRADDIIYDYEAGLETMFIWRMQCIGFDLKFLRRVAQARATYVSKPRAKRIKPGEPMANTLPVARAHAPSPEP